MCRINGDFGISLCPLSFTTPNGKQQESGFFQMVRYPTPDDNAYVPLGVPVSGDYRAFTPRDMARAWDEHMPKCACVETMGVLRRGAIFFLTAKSL